MAACAHAQTAIIALSPLTRQTRRPWNRTTGGAPARYPRGFRL